MIDRVILSPALLAQFEREARAALPRECCGLIEGETAGGAVQVTALHATANIAARRDRFEIDPAEQFRLMRTLRGTGTAIVGCYHSHPEGSADASMHDHAGGGEKGFVWLILAVVDDRSALAAYVCEGERLRPIAIAER